MAQDITYSNDPLYAKVADITAAKTVLASENGTTFVLNAAAGATVTLPSLAQGLRYKFIVGATFATTDWVIDSAEGDNINGMIADMGSTVAVVLAAGEDQVNFELGAESLGDWVELVADMDNSQWLLSGMCGINGGITVTDPS